MIEEIEQGFVWVVWDHPACGLDSMPLRAYRRECDAHASMGSGPHDDFYAKVMALIEDEKAYFFPTPDSNLEWVPLLAKDKSGAVG